MLLYLDERKDVECRKWLECEGKKVVTRMQWQIFFYLKQPLPSLHSWPLAPHPHHLSRWELQRQAGGIWSCKLIVLYFPPDIFIWNFDHNDVGMICIAYIMAPSQSLFVILQPWVLCYHWPHLQNDLMITTCFDIRVLSSLPSFSSSPTPSWTFTLAKSRTNAVSVTMHQLGRILWGLI